MSNRKCQLCKLSQPMEEMQKIGKQQFLCRDKLTCYKRKLASKELAGEP